MEHWKRLWWWSSSLSLAYHSIARSRTQPNKCAHIAESLLIVKIFVYICVREWREREKKRKERTTEWENADIESLKGDRVEIVPKARVHNICMHTHWSIYWKKSNVTKARARDCCICLCAPQTVSFSLSRSLSLSHPCVCVCDSVCRPFAISMQSFRMCVHGECVCVCLCPILTLSASLCVSRCVCFSFWQSDRAGCSRPQLIRRCLHIRICSIY